MSDWYDDGMKRLMADIAETAGVSVEVAQKVYSAATSMGVAGDYDVEKEAIQSLYDDED